MSILKEFAGGILIILLSGIVAIAQNAIRPDGIPLIPKSHPAVSENPYTAPSGGDGARTPAQDRGPAETSEGASAIVPTAEELSSGVISMERLKEILPGGRIVLIDARLPEEFEAGHIDGAINIPYEKLPEYYEKLTASVAQDAFVVCYCRSVTCDDSENLARELKFIGYASVILYKGGWDEWSQAAGAAHESSEKSEAAEGR